VVGRLGAKILRDAVARKAQAVVVACPMCHANLDLRRSSINRRLAAKTSIPVLYITQVIGMALGIPAKQLGLARHLVRVTLPGPSAQTPPAPRPAVQ
jgi:heterodisulfide reductase subunit B